jgi:hypothetical protein
MRLSLLLLLFPFTINAAEPANLIRSAKNGAWSAAETWDGGKVPGEGSRVQIKAGHAIVYDLKEGPAIRLLHIAGELKFATDRNTRLDVGLLKLQPGTDASENGFDCEAHILTRNPSQTMPALIVGSQAEPLDAKFTANIRLAYFEGMDNETCPAIVNCGGRMELHGAPMNRTWVKLGAPAKAGDKEIALHEAVTGWKAGDRIIVTATERQNKVKKTFVGSTKTVAQTEERIIAKIDGMKIKFDTPLKYAHTAEGDYRADVANLSRNVVIESAKPDGVRGHTMFHRDSAGSISYAEFRHLGKDGVLGKYSIHFHLGGDTMRGSSVIGASIWDSHNRWITVHGTNYLVIRDCVGYKSLGHGYFLEDGTEMYNVLDRNLAVQAYITKPLPKQVLPFDQNDGSGFWWANSHNAFTRNCAAECDEYGYFFQAPKTKDFDPELNVMQPDGTRKKVDIRTLPFIRFEDNEAHCQRRHSFNLGGGTPFGPPNVAGVGPDAAHPFVIRNLKLWNVHWGIHPVSPSVVIDGIDISNSEYGIWRPEYKNHAYASVKFANVPEKNYYAFTKENLPPTASGELPKLTDDLPPVTMITHVIPLKDGKLSVRGTTADNGDVKKVVVNGAEAKATRPNFAEWVIVLEGKETKLSAHSEDAAGNIENRPHVRAVK